VATKVRPPQGSRSAKEPDRPGLSRFRGPRVSGATWRVGLVAVLVVGAFAAGLILPTEVLDYSRAQQNRPPIRTLAASFDIAPIYPEGYGCHCDSFTVIRSAPGLVWQDLIMDMYFNGTDILLSDPAMNATVSSGNGTLAVYDMAMGAWRSGGPEPVVVGQTLTFNTAGYDAAGDQLVVQAVSGSFTGRLELTIP
jgi:hypothetical protein